MTVFSDLEMTKLCAEAMEYVPRPALDSAGLLAYVGANCNPEDWFYFDPLTDDAQCFALVKRFKLNIGQLSKGTKVFTGFEAPPFVDVDGPDLNRCIVECVAKMQSAKQSGCIGVGR